jgi:hypothetical protein
MSGDLAAAAPTPLGYRPADEGKSDALAPFFAPVDKGFGGPDLYGYSWIDSDEPSGPTFAWVDISSVGTSVALGDDMFRGPFSIGFAFPFYDTTYTELYIGSNGLITFGSGSDERQNKNIPNTAAPNNMIALWWDDLDPSSGGHVYYYHDSPNNRFVISFVNIPNYRYPDGTGSLTFQAVLYANGRINLQYWTMDPGVDVEGLASATIGIENMTGSDGLQVVYNAAYMHDNLAVDIKCARWLWVDPTGAVIEPYSSRTVDVHLDAAELEQGSYSGQLNIITNDPNMPSVTVPVNLLVRSYLCGDINGDGEGPNVGDITYLVDFLFRFGPQPPVMAAANVNGENNVNVADVTYLVDYLFRSGPAPVCE